VLLTGELPSLTHRLHHSQAAQQLQAAQQSQAAQQLQAAPSSPAPQPSAPARRRLVVA
jgi:hypothetical protein